jgi:hypothetical protein
MVGDRLLNFANKTLEAISRQRDSFFKQAISQTGALLVVELKLNRLIDRHSYARPNPSVRVDKHAHAQHLAKIVLSNLVRTKV